MSQRINVHVFTEQLRQVHPSPLCHQPLAPGTITIPFDLVDNDDKAGPNDTSHVVWASGMFILPIFSFLIINDVSFI